jgi:hypothetical protein
MRTVRTTADLKRLALATGAEVVIDGKPFNTGRSQVSAVPKRAAPLDPPVITEPPPPIPVAESLTRAQVEEMLAAHNQRVTAQIGSIIAALKAPARSDGSVPTEWDFEIRYDSHHAITHVTAKARP